MSTNPATLVQVGVSAGFAQANDDATVPAVEDFMGTWVDPTDLNVETPLMDQLHAHCSEMASHHPVECLLADSNFGSAQDLAEAGKLVINPGVLCFLFKQTSTDNVLKGTLVFLHHFVCCAFMESEKGPIEFVDGQSVCTRKCAVSTTNNERCSRQHVAKLVGV